MVGVKLWLVVGGGDKIMADRGWWWQNYTWSSVIVGGGSKIMAGRGCLWMVVAGREWSWVAAQLPVFFKGNI